METIRAAVEKRLLAVNGTRTFVQMQLPFAPSIPGRRMIRMIRMVRIRIRISKAFHILRCMCIEACTRAFPPFGNADSQPAAAPPTYYRPDKLVRTDPASRSIESYLSNPYKTAAVQGEE